MKRRKKKVAAVKVAVASWSHIALTMLETFPSMNEEGKEMVRKEIGKMARAADAYNDLVG